MCYTFPMSDVERQEEDPGEGAASVPSPDVPVQSRAWWLSTRRHSPEWQSLRAAGTTTFSGRPRSHYRAARPGDPVLIYLSRPDHAIRAVGIVTRGSDAWEPEPESPEQQDESALKTRNSKPTPDPRIEVQ